MATLVIDKTKQGRLAYYHYRREDEATGTVKYSMRLMPYAKMDAAYINSWASSFTGTSEAQMHIAFAALAKAIQYFTLNGHSVTLDGLGTFTFTTKTGVWDDTQQKWVSAGKENMADVSADDIRALYIRFRPASVLRKAISTCQLFNVVATTFGWDRLTNHKPAPDTPSIEVTGQTFKVHAHYSDPPGTPLSYKVGSNGEWKGYSGPVTLPDGGTVYAKAIAGNGKASEVTSAVVPHG